MVAISAHAGGSEQARPATLEAYQQALSSGADYAELDIRRTTDEVLVVFHDDRPQRGGPLVTELTHAQLSAAAGHPVPTAAAVMDLLAGRLHGHLDLKETGYEEQVIALALASFGPAGFVATTMEDESIRAISRAFPDVRTALSLGRGLGDMPWQRWAQVRRSELRPLPRVRACGADWVAVSHRLARLGVIEACRRHGVGVMVWTVDSGRLIDRFLADEHIDVLITNRPRYAARRRAELKAR